MYLLYVDESGDGGTNPGSSRHLVLGGVAIHEGQWKKFTGLLDSVQQSYFPQAPGPVEFHASEIRAGRGAFRDVVKTQRSALMSDIYSIISASPGRRLVLFAAVVEKAAFLAKYSGRVDPYEGAFEGLCTMFNLFLGGVQKRQRQVQRGVVVFDEARPSLTRQLRALVAKFHAGGGQWSSMTNLVETAFFFDSRASRIMQLADFTAYAVYRWYEFGDAQYIGAVYHKLDHDRSRIHGLKCYPLESTKKYPP